MSQTLDRLSEITCKHLEGWEEISPQRRLSALALFQEDLQQLHHDVEEERLKVVEPYRRLVLEVIEHWREVMTSAEAQRVRQVE